MSRRPRRNHTPAFKAKVALAAIKGGGAVRRPPQQITSWKAQLEGEVSMFSIPALATERAHPAIDVKSLHACILA
jgi:transposase